MLILLLAACSARQVQVNPTPDAIPSSLETVIGDMTLAHEGRPHGVPPSYDWALRPRIGMGNDPGRFRAMIAWGQVYEAAEGNPAKNTRVQIRDLKAYVLRKSDNQWHLLQEARRIEGAAYREDFVDDLNRPADIRVESDGSVSVVAGDGYNFHFWAPGRVPIDPQDIAGIFIVVQARLILHDPTQPDDRAQARYLLSIGGDYWLTTSAQWDQFRTNGDIGIGRFKYVQAQWQIFSMITLSEAQIRANPPPLN